ncbi:MAG TPA: condensation domain-containing protein, partial [Longimicrobium sp.]|nr:condensation domain-containing protein [Longimicrobium sp.]
MTDLADRLAALSPAKRALLTRLRAAPALAPIPRIADGPAPLSLEQRRLWYQLQLAPGYPLYTIPLGFRLRGRVDVDALVDALRELVQRHEVLRTAFRESAGIPVQEVTDGSAFRPEVMDLRGDEWAEPEANYQTDAFTRRPYDLAAGETIHALLVRETDDELRFFVGLHHLAADGWSAGVLLRELSALYAARVTGVPANLPDPPVRYRDWAAWQQRPDR